MRLLVLDPYDDGGTGSLDVAWRAQRAGHEVKFFQKRGPKNELIGRDLVDCVSDYAPWLKWADLIFNADNTSYLDVLEREKAEGQLVISGNKETSSWELDREKGMKIFESHGIAVPPYRQFDDYDDAISYVKKEMKRFVSKPCGDVDKALTYVSKSPQDMVFMLEKWKRMGKLKCPFILQEFVGGIEMAVGGWCGPNGFIEGWCENFEFKKLMAGDLGVATGEMGTVLAYTKKSKLAQKVLKPVEETVAATGYCSYIDVNCIIDEKGNPWPLEFTTRPGWPTCNIQYALDTRDFVEWMMEFAEGRDPKQFRMDETAIGVVIAVPDFPYSHVTRKEVVGTPIYGLWDNTLENIHPVAVYVGKAPNQVGNAIVDRPTWLTAGDYVLVVTATGATVTAARNTVYRRVERVELPSSPMWRIDIGKRLQKQLPDLQKNGYALGFRYS